MSSSPASAGSPPEPRPEAFEGLIADVEPLDVNGIRTVQVGTALWFVTFVALLPFYGRLREHGHLWWLWTCMAGVALGLFGLEYVRRRAGRA